METSGHSVKNQTTSVTIARPTLSNLVLKVATSTLATWKLEGVSDFALVMLLRFANVFATFGLGHTFWPNKNPVKAVGMAHILSLEDVCAASPRRLASPRRQFLPAGWAPCDAVTIRAPATQIGSVVETCLETILETILERIRLVRSLSARHHCGALPDERATVAHEACDGTVQMDVRISFEASHPSWAPLWGPLCAHGGPHYGPIAGPRGALFAFCGRPRVRRTHANVDALEKKRHVNSLIWGPKKLNIEPQCAPILGLSLVIGPTRGPIIGA